MKWGVIEIIPTDPSLPGILANITKLVADAKLSVRQAIVDDFELSSEPRLYIVTEKQVPGFLIPKIRKSTGVKAVVVY
jgi:predicted regulator of amino acid metabolism with ACT domain